MRHGVPNSGWAGSPTTGGRRGVSGIEEQGRAGSRSGPPSRAAQVDGGPQRRERPSLRAGPHRLREFHDGAPKQAARRVFVKIGNERNCGPANRAHFLRGAQVCAG